MFEEPTNYFDGDSGIYASARFGRNSLDYPEIEISIANTTQKEIAAVKFYVVPFDVYGEEIRNFAIENEILSDIAIPVGKTTEISEMLLDNDVKTIELYVYSVYFSDGTEWGNKDAKRSEILNGAPKIGIIVNS